jgi:hypothetical protein
VINQGLEAIATLEDQNPLAEANEALQSFTGRIGARFQSGMEAIREIPRNVKTFAALGASALTLFTLANAEKADAQMDPFAAENVPGLAGATTLPGAPETNVRPQLAPHNKIGISSAIPVSNGIEYLANTATSTAATESLTEQPKAETSETNDLVASCTDAELVKPDVEKVEIRDPGKSYQTTNTTINMEATPEECHDVVNRLFQYEVIVKRTIKIHDKLRRTTVRLARWGDSYFNREEAGFIGGSNVANPHNSRQLAKCSPGRANTTARLKVRGVITDSATKQEVDRKIWWGPVDIRRKKPC